MLNNLFFTYLNCRTKTIAIIQYSFVLKSMIIYAQTMVLLLIETEHSYLLNFDFDYLKEMLKD